jgi:16S rRNA (guanine527-N7)-methyltransferase
LEDDAIVSLLSAAPAPLVAGPGPSPENRASIDRWLALLREWNARIDLTAARTDAELEDLMLADAVLLATLRTRSSGGEDGALLLPTGSRVVDVGAGAGAPGLALALLRPDLKVTLVEPLAKRVSFLRTVIGSLGRTDVTLWRGRGEELARKSPGAFDVAISRATLAPAAWVPVGLSLARSAWALLAREEPPSVPGATIDVDVTYAWPRTSAARRAVRYEAGRAAAK